MKYSEYLKFLRTVFVTASLVMQFVGMLTDDVLPEMFAFVSLICAVMHECKRKKEVEHENEEAEIERQKVEQAKQAEEYYDRQLARSKEFKRFSEVENHEHISASM